MLDCVPCKDFYILTLSEFLRSDQDPRIGLELNELTSLKLSNN